MKRPATPSRGDPPGRSLDGSPSWEEQPTHPGVALTRRVLVAEDDAALRDLMARHLAFEGYFVTEAADAQAMLDAVRAMCESRVGPFDLIVTDVRMPGMTGLDALARIRESGCHTPTIVVSALPGEMVLRELQALDALFLPKPFALENLRRIANRMICGHQCQNLATP